MGHAHITDPTATTGGGALGATDRALHRVEKFTALLSGLGIFLLMIVGVVQILSRKLLNMPIFGYIDMVEIAMSLIVFLAISYTERLGGHIRMEILVSFLKGRALWLFEMVGTIVGLVIIGVLTYFSWLHVERAYTGGDSTIDAQIPLWPSKLMVPISLGLLFIRLCVSLWAFVRLIVSPSAPVIGVPELIDASEQALREAESAMGATGVAGENDVVVQRPR